MIFITSNLIHSLGLTIAPSNKEIPFMKQIVPTIFLSEESEDFGANPLGTKYFWRLDGMDKAVLWY